jgi:hypothetical protein
MDETDGASTRNVKALGESVDLNFVRLHNDLMLEAACKFAQH